MNFGSLVELLTKRFVAEDTNGRFVGTLVSCSDDGNLVFNNVIREGKRVRRVGCQLSTLMQFKETDGAETDAVIPTPTEHKQSHGAETHAETSKLTELKETREAETDGKIPTPTEFKDTDGAEAEFLTPTELNETHETETNAEIPTMTELKETGGAEIDAEIPTLTESRETDGAEADAEIPSPTEHQETNGAETDAEIPTTTEHKETREAESDDKIPTPTELKETHAIETEAEISPLTEHKETREAETDDKILTPTEFKETDEADADAETFDSLLLKLESTDASNTGEITAIVNTLSMVGKKVPKEELAVYSDQFLKAITDKLTNLVANGKGDRKALKHLIVIIGRILQSQPADRWDNSSNISALASVMSFAAYEDRWVRAAVALVVRDVITESEVLDNGVHPVAELVAQDILDKLRTCEESEASTTTSRLLTVLEGIMDVVPQKAFDSLLDFVLKLCGKAAKPSVRRIAIQCIYQVLRRKPSSEALTSDRNKQLVRDLRGILPEPSEKALWLKAMIEAHVCLAEKDRSRSGEQVPEADDSEASAALLVETVDICVKMSSSGSKRLGHTLLNVLGNLFDNCVTVSTYPKAAEDCLQVLEKSLFEQKVAEDCLHVLDKSLSEQNPATVMFALKSMASLLDAAQASVVGDVFQRVMRTLAAIRDAEECSHAAAIDEVFASAFRSLGMQHVLAAINDDYTQNGPTARGASLLGIDLNGDILPGGMRRLWLLPVLKRSIQNAPLGLFVNDFLPLAERLHARADSLSPSLANLCSSVEGQLWELLPPFIKSAVDFQEVFPKFASQLILALNYRPDLRPTILASIRAAAK